tara:strand:- start:4558 stop:5313 length:756 start_codon:yes stop_codon:yes gene_type:complete
VARIVRGVSIRQNHTRINLGAKIMENVIQALSKPFPFDRIHWRVGSTTKDAKRGLALAYLDARDVMDRMDQVCGSSWSDTYFEVAGRVVCSITINGITRSDGAGDTVVEAEKGGLSDAYKRCAVKWGVGRYLYRLESEWVALDGKKRIIKPPEMPAWALPADDVNSPDIPFDQVEKDHKTINEKEITQEQADLINAILDLESILVETDRLTSTARTAVRRKHAKVVKLEAATLENLKTYYAQLTEFQRSNP